VCLNWIDIQHYRPFPPLRPAPVADASLVIAVVCAMRPEKGLLTLIDAFAESNGVGQGSTFTLTLPRVYRA